MKKFFASVGKAICYFLAYFGMQMILSFIFTFCAGLVLGIRLGASGESFAPEEINERLLSIVNQYAMLITLISGALTVALFVIFFLVRKKRLSEAMCLRKFSAKGIVPIMLLGASINVFISLIFSIIPFPDSWINDYRESSSAITAGSVIVSLLATVIAAPVTEELTFRALMYTRLKKGMPAFIAALASSLIFGIVHGSPIWMIYTFAFGMLLIWIFERFDSALACILLHMVFNVVGMLPMPDGEISDAVYWTVLGVSAVIAIASALWVFLLTRGEYNVRKLRPEIHI